MEGLKAALARGRKGGRPKKLSEADIEVGRALHDRERDTGNIAVMAQLLAGAQQDLLLAEAGRYAMARWCEQLEAVVRRLMADSPLAEVVDPAGTRPLLCDWAASAYDVLATLPAGPVGRGLRP